MLSHQKTHDNLTGEINHFITSIFFVRKKGKGAEVLALWDLLSFSLPHCYLFSFHCSLMVSALPKTKAFFLLFNFILHCTSQTSHDWNSRNDLFLTVCHIQPIRLLISQQNNVTHPQFDGYFSGRTDLNDAPDLPTFAGVISVRSLSQWHLFSPQPSRASPGAHQSRVCKARAVILATILWKVCARSDVCLT